MMAWGITDRITDSIPAGLFPNCDLWPVQLSQLGAAPWDGLLPTFREHHGTAGVGPSQEGSQSALAPPCHLYPWGCREEEWGRSRLGTEQAWPNPDPKGCTLNQDCGPRGELGGGLPSAELSWGAKGPQSTNELPPPQEWLQVQNHTRRSTVRTKET